MRVGRSSPVLRRRLCSPPSVAQADPLPSWNDGPVKAGDPRLRARASRRWAEPTSWRCPNASPPSTMTARCGPSSPATIQAIFALDQAEGAGRAAIPTGRHSSPSSGLLDGRSRSARRHGREGHARDHSGHAQRPDHRGVQAGVCSIGWPRLVIRASSGPIPTSSISRCSSCWPYLRANQFKTFIVSGGGVEFMRPWTEQAYGIPPEQVVGSSGVTKYRCCGTGKPVLMKMPKVEFVDDGPGKARRHQPVHRAPVRSSPSATPTATSRCWNGRRPAPVRASWVSCTTPMPCANAPMIATRTIGRLDKAWDEAVRRRVGSWST